MSLVHNAELMTRVKTINMREEQRLRRHLLDVDQARQERLQALKVQRQELVRELRAHRMRGLKTMASRLLKEEDRLAMELQSLRGKTTPQRRPQLRLVPDFEATRGFSKLDVRDEEDDIIARAAKLQKGQAERRGSKDELEIAYSEKVPYVPDEDILVYSPTEIGNKTWKRTVDVVPVSSTILSAEYRRRLLEGKPAPFCPETAQSLTRSLAQPSYVNLLRQMETGGFSQHTDGSMALTMRRFRHQQRERHPPLPGHLPVRWRPSSRAWPPTEREEKIAPQSPDTPDPDDHQLPSSRAWSMSKPAAISLHFRIPKPLRVDRTVEESEENSRILRLRKAGQTSAYEAALRRTSTFLAGKPSGVDLVQRVQLTREEIFLLSQFQGAKSTSESMQGLLGSGP